MSLKIQEMNIVFYDGECGLCNLFVKYILKYEKNHDLFFCPLDSEIAKKNLTNQLSDTVVYLQRGKEFYRSEAALMILKEMKWPTSMFYYFKVIPLFIRDYIYKLIAKNRHKLFRRNTECLFVNQETKKRFL
mgnify:CR=1 FL=1